jgi:membrane associated rhomboid family serine protease
MNTNINSFNNFNSGNDSQGSAGDRIKASWAAIPIFVKIVVTLTVGFYILSWPFENFINIFVNIPAYTILKLNIWRAITSVFVTLNLLNIIFAFISWIPDAIRLENTIGTAKYAMNFMINATLINIFYIVLMFIFAPLFGKGALMAKSAGLWPLIMAEITLLCLANPENPVALFFLPCQFAAKYYPWALLGLFTVMNAQSFQFDLLCGILYGYLYFYYLRNYLSFSNETISNWEQKFIFRHMKKFNGFIPLTQTSTNSAFTVIAPSAQQSASNIKVEQPKQHPVTTPFKGKGTVVGTIKLT